MLRLRQLREEQKLTRAEAAARAAVHPARWGAIENGREIPRDESVVLARMAVVVKWKGRPAALLEEVDGGGSSEV